MKALNRYAIEVRCSDPAWSCYKVNLLCEELDAAAARIGVSTAETTRLRTAPCHTARLFLYVLPHTLPSERSIEAVKPLKISVKITCNDRALRTEHHVVNPWGGLSLTLTLAAE